MKDKEAKAEWDPKSENLTISAPINERESFEQGFADLYDEENAVRQTSGTESGAGASVHTSSKKKRPPVYEIV